MLNCFPKEAKLVTEERIPSGSASVYPIAASFSLSCTCHSLVPLTAGFLLDAGSEDVQRRRWQVEGNRRLKSMSQAWEGVRTKLWWWRQLKVWEGEGQEIVVVISVSLLHPFCISRVL